MIKRIYKEEEFIDKLCIEFNIRGMKRVWRYFRPQDYH